MFARACARCSGVGGCKPINVCFWLRPELPGGTLSPVEGLSALTGFGAGGGADGATRGAGATAAAGTTGGTAGVAAAGATGGTAGVAAPGPTLAGFGAAAGTDFRAGMGAGGGGGGAGSAAAGAVAGPVGAGASEGPTSQLGLKNSASRSASSVLGKPGPVERVFGPFAIPRSARLAPGQRAAQFAPMSLVE